MPPPEPVPVTPALLRGWPLPQSGGDKEARGRVLVVGGSDRTPGAVALAGEAALRCGAGKLEVATVQAASGNVALALPEALVAPLPQSAGGHIGTAAAEQVVELASACAAVLIGPGLRDAEAAVALLSAVVPRLEAFTVLDGVALAFLDDHREALRHLEGRAVLTANRKELARTLGVDQSKVDADPAAAARELAASTCTVVAAGGATSWIADPAGRVWREDGGGPGLGTSGSGDVKAGIVAGLAARGAEPEQAAVWAEHLHGQAGERLAASLGPLGYLARELPGQLPPLLAALG